MKRTGLVVVLLALVGALVWFVGFRGKGAGGGAGGPVAGGGAEGTGKRPGGLAPEDGPAARAPRDLNVLIDDDKEGTLRLEGLVLDADDQPVGGATVTVSTNPPRSTTSEADGSFAFDKLVARGYQLVARAPAGVGGPVTARLTTKSDPVTLRLRAAASVEITVLEAASKKPVAGATVELRDLEVITGVTGPDGKAVLAQVAPGGYQVMATAPGFAKAYAFMGVGRGGGGVVVETETLELRPGALVSGVVRDEAGKPVAGALVSFAGVAEWQQQADPRRDAVTTDDKGEWKLEAMPRGTFRFTARHEQYAPGVSPQVTLDGQSEKRDVTLVLQPGAVIAGKVVDAGGAAVPFATVRVVARVDGWSFEDARMTTSDEGGAFQMTGLPRKQLDVVGAAEAATSETLEVDVTSVPEKKDLVVRLANVGVIAGIVVDGQGEPIPEATVTAMPDMRRGGPRGDRRAARQDFRLRGFSSEIADAGGRFVLKGLADDEYLVRASRPGKGRGGMWAREGVSAKVGDENVKVVLESEGGVKGKVLFDKGHPPELFTVSVGMGASTPFSSKDGAFELDDVTPGKRQLVVSGPSFDRVSLEIEIESDKVTDAGTITVTQGRKLVGRVLDARGTPVPNAEVIAGRRLFGNGNGAQAVGGRGGGGPPGMGGFIRTTTTDEQGAFALYGIGPRDLAIQASHETLGASTLVTLPGAPSDSTIDLVLQPFGALEGFVLKEGRPAEGMGVSISSQKVPNSNFFVQTGPDGAFRYDRLAPDTYLVQAVNGQNPMSGLAFVTQVVTVEPGKTARVKIDVKPGGTVVADVKLADGGRANFALVQPVGSAITPKNGKELLYMGAAAGASTAFGISFGGQPARIQGLPPGRYTVCAVPFPAEIRGMGPTMQYMEREGENLPTYCVPAEVREGSEAKVTITVDKLPAFVPPPAGPQQQQPPGGAGGTPPPGGT